MADGEVVELGDAITDGTVEGWFIPRYIAGGASRADERPRT